MNSFEVFSGKWLPVLESELAACMSQAARELTIGKAGEYALMGPGKRIRPLLTLMAADACGGDPKLAMPAAMAIEMVHAFSLVHDDLPCMDDDDVRRGRPTTHKVYGEAMALLAGDALLASTFQKIALLPAEISVKCSQELSNATVMMIEGQTIDIGDAQKSPEELDHMNALKTGMLITCALKMGAICAGASQDQIDALTEYGRALGLAFQITDDLLDGEEGSRTRAEELVTQAVSHLRIFGGKATHLTGLAESIPGRTG